MKYTEAIAYTSSLFLNKDAAYTMDEKKALTIFTAKQLEKAVKENKLEKLVYHDYKLRPFNVYRLGK